MDPHDTTIEELKALALVLNTEEGYSKAKDLEIKNFANWGEICTQVHGGQGYDFKKLRDHLNGKPYHSDESLQRAIKAVEDIQKQPEGTEFSIQLDDIFGNPCTRKILLEKPERYGVEIQSYFKSAEYLARPLANLGVEFPLCPFYPDFLPCDTSGTIPEPSKTDQDWLDKVEKTWKASKYRSEIQQFFIDHTNQLSPVDKVVCIGLGGPRYFNPYEGYIEGKEDVMLQVERSMMQHFAAAEIRQAIADLQHVRPETIKLLAQDPQYTGRCRSIIVQLGFEFLDPRPGTAFSNIDQQSFVVTIGLRHLSECVHGPGGGGAPAGMFIDDRSRDIEAEREGNPVSSYSWDDEAGRATSAMIRYREKCITKTIEDPENWFSNAELRIKKKPDAQ